MNPEEGELRPQLLDRFGLVVEVEPMNDRASERRSAQKARVRHRPGTIPCRMGGSRRTESERIAEAQHSCLR